MNRKLIFTLLGVVAVLLIGAIVAVNYANRARAPISTPPNGSLVTIKGMQVCLPHKEKGGMQTLECAIGLQDEAGYYYGLRNWRPDYESGYDSTQSITVTGTFFNDTSGIYDIVGYINVESISNSGPVQNGTIQPLTPIQPEASTTPAANSASWKYWRTSENHFVVRIPVDWKVSQSDAGGASGVNISSPDNKREMHANLGIFIQRATDFDGENKISFSTWVRNGGSKDSQFKPSVSSNKNISLGGLSVISQVENGTHVAYYADLGDNAYLSIKYALNDRHKNILEDMVTTFNFKPTQTQLQSATVIP